MYIFFGIIALYFSIFLVSFSRPFYQSISLRRICWYAPKISHICPTTLAHTYAQSHSVTLSYNFSHTLTQALSLSFTNKHALPNTHPPSSHLHTHTLTHTLLHSLTTTASRRSSGTDNMTKAMTSLEGPKILFLSPEEIVFSSAQGTYGHVRNFVFVFNFCWNFLWWIIFCMWVRLL